jgi:HPt (histidine-containing phosphotransfer) domain-containing protein
MRPLPRGGELLDFEVIRDLAEVTSDSGPGFLRAVLERFAVDALDCIERMRRHARRGDTASLAREAHRLKGSSGTVGALLLAAECREIEQSARAGLCTGMEPKIEQAHDVLDATRVGLVAFFRGTIAAAA